ncbi:MAG: alpha/beta hydrolase, partial [Rhodospirillaceae bacterium]|nr:alpha/beta hydrolase [Rhodospirillaceae bacterium]
AEEVVASMNEALSQVMVRLPGRGVRLVGYSGGGAVAALLAERRTDVLSLRTVAGNLDIEAVNRHHRVSAMPDSLNPIDVAPRLASLPQIHFVGGKDRVVPPFVAHGFVAAMGIDCCVQIVLEPLATHDDGWEAAWQMDVKMPPSCRR